MKLWLDAAREPEVDWVWAKTAHCAITMLTGGCVEKISLAPDQSAITTEVTDWMIAHESSARSTIHDTTGGVTKSRLLKIPAQKTPEASRAAS